ncbi:MAG: RDD family protein, partial [Candidatus Acidiferrales bacterium]
WQGTLGKRALGLLVTDLEGRRVSFGRASGRYFGKIVSALILMIGFIMAGFTEKKQALHDMLAGCLVLRKL